MCVGRKKADATGPPLPDPAWVQSPQAPPPPPFIGRARTGKVAASPRAEAAGRAWKSCRAGDAPPGGGTELRDGRSAGTSPRSPFQVEESCLPKREENRNSAVSLDLLNLYVVNQISTKKENAENIRKPIHVDINRETKIPLRKQNVEFPKSPECRPTKLSLDDIQHRIQEEILDSRRKYHYEKASVHSEDLGSTRTIINKEEDFWLSTTAYRPEEFSVPDPEAPVGLYFQQLNSHIEPLFTDLGDAKEIFSRPSLYDGEEMHQRTGPRYAAERDLTSILTAPEMICSLDNQSLNAINQNPVWNQSNHCSIQKRDPEEFSDQQQLTTFFDNIGGFKNQKKYTKAPKTIKNDLKNSRKKGRPDPSMDYLKIFEHETLDKDIYSDFDQHWKQSRQNDDDSQLTSQSPTYSPKQADRHTSSSSDESKAEEWNEEASSDSEGSFSRTSNDPYLGSGCQRSEYVCLFDGKPQNTANIQPQAKPAITPKKNRLHRAKLQLFDRNDKGKHDASSQTDACAEPVEKCNAAVQCDIIQGCNCKKELSFTHSAEIVTSTSKVETTGGQTTPAESAVLQPTNRKALLIKNFVS
ncbi:putative protein C12orf40 like [Crotalus adamanteus]|uniref:Uncharacterized protein n=1 Tax=Crotalus adamanteus TaxID=8729 RepID=A0AAW1BBQ3_CROAD